MSWTPSLITLFDDCKNQLVTSPLLLRYDNSKPVFLKTDWSTGGTGYMLMKADKSPQSLVELTLLEATGKCTFDLSLDDPRLRPMFFGSRSNQTFEVHYHSFIREVACGRRAISCCRKYLRGKKFYWIYDCIAIQEIFKYCGSIHQLRRWSQELFGYEFFGDSKLKS